MAQERNKPIKYMHKRSCYQLEWEQERILIKCEDLSEKKMYSVIVNNEMASLYGMKAHQIYQQLYKQYLFQSSKDRTMIRCQGNTLTLHFNIPKTKLKQMQFQCAVQTTDQLLKNKNAIQLLVQTKIQQIGRLLQDAISTISQNIQLKINQAVKTIEEKLASALLPIDSLLHNKIISFQQYCKNKENQYQKNYIKFLTESVDQIIEDNYKYFNQFNQIRLDLESSIQILNGNLKSEYQRVDQLQRQIEFYKEALEDSTDKANFTYQALKERMQKQFKQIYSQIQNLASSLPQGQTLHPPIIQQEKGLLMSPEAKVEISDHSNIERQIKTEQECIGLFDFHSFSGGEG